MFKSNSRFSSLLDDINDSKKDRKTGKNKDKERDNERDKERDKEREKNSVENKEHHFNSFKSPEKENKNRYSYNEKENVKERQAEVSVKKELRKKELERLNLEILNINNFPELISVTKKEVKHNVSYLSMLKKEEEIKESNVDPDLVNLRPGCLLIKKDQQTRNTVMKYGLGTVFYEEPSRSEKEIILDVVDTLIELHEKRTEEYIELNGYDVWEKMFKYPNWEEREAYLYEIDEPEDTSEEEDDHDDENYDDYDYDDYGY